MNAVRRCWKSRQRSVSSNSMPGLCHAPCPRALSGSGARQPAAGDAGVAARPGGADRDLVRAREVGERAPDTERVAARARPRPPAPPHAALVHEHDAPPLAATAAAHLELDADRAGVRAQPQLRGGAAAAVAADADVMAAAGGGGR